MALANVCLVLKAKYVKKGMLSMEKFMKIEMLFATKDGLVQYVFNVLKKGDIKLCPGNCNDRGSCVNGKCK
jgi:hypothetical protein